MQVATSLYKKKPVKGVKGHRAEAIRPLLVPTKTPKEKMLQHLLNININIPFLKDKKCANNIGVGSLNASKAVHPADPSRHLATQAV